MNAKKILSLALGICASISVILYFQKNSDSLSQRSGSDIAQAKTQEQNLALNGHPAESALKTTAAEAPSQTAASQNKGVNSSTHELTEDNLEEMVGRCYQGEPCELKEDPWQLYLKFKNSGRTHATDTLISYMRKELKNPKYRDQYKDVLLKMIDDFYPSNGLNIPTNSRDFQHAAYYYYLGDVQTSLDIYLKMEKAAANDPHAFDPFKLNIANDYYELHRWKEALAYYRKALDESLSEKLLGPDQQAAIHFIQDRIGELERK